MPLPEHEQRQLRQIEQALCRDDPKFGRRMRASDPRMRYKRKLLQALLGVVIGAGLLAAGAVTHRIYLDAAGVVTVLLSLVWAVVSWRRYVARVRPARSGAGTTTATGTTKHRSGQTWRARMMERMAERWRRRQQGNGGMPGRTRS
jgi:Protein of unknown function (DUF3040)